MDPRRINLACFFPPKILRCFKCYFFPEDGAPRRGGAHRGHVGAGQGVRRAARRRRHSNQRLPRQQPERPAAVPAVQAGGADPPARAAGVGSRCGQPPGTRTTTGGGN